MKKPDFAYPATVSQNSEAQLKSAVSAHDAVSALRALMTYSVSQTMIDNANAQDCIRLALSTADSFKDSDIYGLYLGFIAKMYYSVYTSRQWVYDGRQLPLTPLPDDLTEWSGDQFKAKIAQLCSESISAGNIAKLSKLNIKDYSEIIVVTDLAALYYPTLADFAYANALVLSDGSDNAGIIRQAIDFSKHSVPAQILWRTTYICGYDNDDADVLFDICDVVDTHFDNDMGTRLIKLYDEYRDSKYAGYIMERIGAIYDNGDMDKRRLFMSLANEYIDRVPDCLFKNNILNCITTALSRDLSIEFPTVCALSEPVKVKVQCTSAPKCHIKVYYLGDNYNRYKTSLKGRTPMQTLNVSFDREAPFKQDTTVTLTLNKPGYYALYPTVGNETGNNNRFDVIRCLPVYPVAIADLLTPTKVVVVDPTTGAPISDALVKAMLDKHVVESAKTDLKGIATLNRKGDNKYPSLVVGYKGANYDFSGNSINLARQKERDDDMVLYRANVLTDRAIYHQGDEIKVLGIFYKSTTRPDGKSDMQLLAEADVNLVLFDANFSIVETLSAKTDAFGRAMVQFTVPTDRMTGRYSIEGRIADKPGYLGNKSVMVSDFKMPDYELVIKSIACDVPSKGCVTVNGSAKTYSGMPVSDADLSVTVRRFDRGVWWRGNYAENIYTASASTAADGTYSIVLPDSIFADDNRNMYSVTLSAVSSTGEAVEATDYFTLKAQYFISLNVKDSTVNGELPLEPNVTVTDAEGQSLSIPLVWTVKKGQDVIASGSFDGTIDISKLTPGTYDLIIGAEDRDLADDAATDITIYNVSTGVVPDDAVLWSVSDQYTISDTHSIDVLVGVGRDNTTLYYTVTSEDRLMALESVKLSKGYHKLTVDIAGDNEQYSLTMFTVKDCNTYRKNININRKRSSGLKITGESFRDNLVPSSVETWYLKVAYADGTPLQAALALDMYNKALEALNQQSFDVNFYGRQSNGNYWLRSMSNYNISVSAYISEHYLKQVVMGVPEFELYGYGLLSRGIMVRGYSSMKQMKSRTYAVADMAIDNATMPTLKDEVMLEEEAEYEPLMSGNLMMSAATGSDDGRREDTDNVQYREAKVPLAIWAPGLTTDGEGNITYTFTVPNANTTWRLRSVAWSQDMEVGQLMHDFVAAKPIMVQPNLPRFLRAGDRAIVLASVINNTASADTITTTVQLFNPVTSEVIKTEVVSNIIDPQQSAVVSIAVAVDTDLNAIGYRIKSTNGDFTDGEQTVIRVLPSESALIETKPFYLNHGEGEFSTKLPKDKGARISLTFCENPVWTVVSALPGLRTDVGEYANAAAAAIYSASVSQSIINDNPDLADAIKTWLSNPNDSALVTKLQQNQDLKIAILNCTPWVLAAQSDNERMANLAMVFDKASIDSSVKGGIKILKDLQKPDGGWAWGKWCNESSVWVTSNVLAMLGSLKDCGWLPKDKDLDKMITKAVKYYDQSVEHVDMLYCLVRPYFKDITINNNGNKVISNTLNDINKDWKSYVDPSYKAMAAMALYLNGDKSKAHEIMGSVSQFGVYTKDQGLKFPSVNALYSYAILLEAFGMIEPDSKAVDGLRQQLIVRKQATDWGSAVVTTEVVKSILTSGSKWTSDAKGAVITAGNHTIQPNSPIESATGSLTADLSQYAGDKLTVKTSGTGPSYGAVYSQFSRQMDAVKASGCADLDIEKKLTVKRGSQWYDIDSLQVGDRVKVQLTIHCKRNLSYVSIIDERPATFEPVIQTPGWIWSEDVAFYRENRDSETDMHIVYMRPGTYLLTYEMNVNLAGRFSSGVASIQSQYAPEMSAHSSGSIINVNSKP